MEINMYDLTGQRFGRLTVIGIPGQYERVGEPIIPTVLDHAGELSALCSE